MRTTVDQTTGDRSRRRRRLRIALVASVAVVLAAAGSAAAFQALPPGGQVNDDLAAGINPKLSVSGEDPTNADVVGGALTAGGKAGPVGDLPPAGGGRRPRPDLLPLVREGRVDDARQRHRRRALERRPDVQRLAQLRPGAGRRGARDRLRRAPAGRCRGRRGTRTRPGPASATKNIFASRFDNTGDANQGKWIFAGQGRGNGGGASARSVAEHPHQPGRREPVGRGRLGGRPDQARSVGDLAGDDRRAGRRQGSDLRRAADRPRRGELRRRHAGGVPTQRPRARDRRLLLAADRRRARRARRRRPEPERRPDARRRRARHRVHRAPSDSGAVGRLVRDRTAPNGGQRRCTTTRWCSPPRASPTASPASTAASTGWPSATTLRATLDTTGTPTASAPARDRRRARGSAR